MPFRFRRRCAPPSFHDEVAPTHERKGRGDLGGGGTRASSVPMHQSFTTGPIVGSKAPPEKFRVAAGRDDHPEGRRRGPSRGRRRNSRDDCV
jgi:hypothetical protein